MKAIILSLSILLGVSAHAANQNREGAVVAYLNQHFHVSFVTANYDLSDIMMDNGLNLRDAYRAAGYEISVSNLQRAVGACEARQTTTTLRCVEQNLR